MGSRPMAIGEIHFASCAVRSRCKLRVVILTNLTDVIV